MRLSQHSGRCEGLAKHNDRSFMQDMKEDYKYACENNLELLKEKLKTKELYSKCSESDLEKIAKKVFWTIICDRAKIDATNINPDLTENNHMWNWAGNKTTFEKGEKLFYEKYYSADLERKNKHYKKKGNIKAVRTIDEVLKSEKTAPEELVLSIGKKGDTVDSDTAKKCFNEYVQTLNQWNMEHGDHMKILNLALHRDEEEGVDHLHLRRTWDYVDKYGNLVLNQNKALELCGIEPPDPSQKISQYNNRKMTFDNLMREKWLDICEKHGVKVEREPLIDKKRHMSVKEYKETKIAEKANALEKNIKDFVNNSLEDLMIMTDKNKSTSEHLRAHTNFVNKANDFIKNNEYHYNIKTSDDLEDNKLKDWNSMNQMERDEEEAKAYLREVHI